MERPAPPFFRPSARLTIEIVKDGLDAREQAVDYIKSHAKAMAA
jgi:hypothetical protein